MLPSQSASTAQFYGNFATMSAKSRRAMLVESLGWLTSSIRVNNDKRVAFTGYGPQEQLVCEVDFPAFYTDYSYWILAGADFSDTLNGTNFVQAYKGCRGLI